MCVFEFLKFYLLNSLLNSLYSRIVFNERARVIYKTASIRKRKIFYFFIQKLLNKNRDFNKKKNVHDVPEFDGFRRLHKTYFAVLLLYTRGLLIIYGEKKTLRNSPLFTRIVKTT